MADINCARNCELVKVDSTIRAGRPNIRYELGGRSSKLPAIFQKDSLG